MLRRISILIAFVVFIPAILFAQDGKLRGTVTDKETKEALIGVNVVIDGTTLGAATDVNGEYVVLGVPPGLYTVRVTYIGYQAQAVSNIRVSANLTTTHDFQLVASAVEVDALEIIAERPLIQRNTTNTVRLTTQEDIENLPIRGVQNIIALNAGTVLQDGVLHVRGGRSNEIGYFVDGATATNPYSNSENVSVIQEAIEEIQLQSGGYTAEFGGANSGIVRTTVRTGSSQFKASLDYRTDDFVKSGEEFLGTTPFGYRNGVLTLSGPLTSKMKFFIAGQHNYQRDANPTYITPFGFENLVDDGSVTSANEGNPLPGTVGLKMNHLPNNYSQNNQIQGTLVYDMNQLKFRFTGSYAHNLRGNGNSTINGALANLFRGRQQETTTQTGLGALRMTHLLGPTTFYEVNLSYSQRFAETVDPEFGSDFWAYPDSLRNAELGYTGWISRYTGPNNISIINNYRLNAPGTPFNSYGKDAQSDIGFSADFTTQLTKNWELKAGGRFDRWTMRSYGIGNISAGLAFLNGVDGKTPRTFDSDYQRRVQLSRAAGISYYGYDVDGNTLNSGADGPRNPIFASFYVQNKLEYRDLIVNLGLRYERIDTQAPRPADIEDPAFDKTLDYIDESQLVETEASDYLLPRVTFSFPVTDQTVFYALYGKYVQMPSLNQVYQSIRDVSRSVSPVTRSPYGYFGNLIGFTAKPERTTQYELGIRQSLSDNFAFTITGFYKDLRDQLRRDKVRATGEETLAAGTVVFSGLLNNDFGTVKGVEMTLELRRYKRLAAKINYTLSDTRGTGSNSASSRVVVSDATTTRYPTFITPLDYNQPHRGSILLDYRFAKGDGGKILQGTGFNAVVSFNSGHAYTKIAEPENLGQASPWNIGVRALQDPRFRNPEEAVNSSLTPWNFNIDFDFSKMFYFDKFNVELYVNVLNLLNTKNVINVFPNTGTAQDDGWLRSPLAGSFTQIPNYTDFYRTVNLENRAAYIGVTGTDIYGQPRQLRFGMKLELF